MTLPGKFSLGIFFFFAAFYFIKNISYKITFPFHDASGRVMSDFGGAATLCKGGWDERRC